MSNLLADAKTRLHTILEDLESVDENAVGALVAAKSNPTVVSIVNIAASVAHLPDPDGLLSGFEAMLKAGASALQHAAQATAPTAPATVAAPVAAAMAVPPIPGPQPAAANAATAQKIM